MDMPSIFGGETIELQDLDLDMASTLDDFARGRDQSIGFRHFARTGVLAAGRTADQQDARRGRRIVVPPLGVLDRLTGGDPVDRKVIVRVGIARPAFFVSGLLR